MKFKVNSDGKVGSRKRYVRGGSLLFYTPDDERGQSKCAGLIITLGDRTRFRSFIIIFFFRERESAHLHSCKQETGGGGGAKGEAERES